MKRLYALIAFIGVIIRQFILPNPFECFGDNAFIMNLVAEPIIHSISFALVGLVYRSGDAPILGSVLYLITYGLIIGVLYLCSIFSFAWWWVLCLAVLFIGVVFGIKHLASLFDGEYFD